MFGHLGYSFVGQAFLLMLIIPNLFWTKYKPQGYNPANENKLLLLLEKAGQILVVCTALFFSDYDSQGWSSWSWWLIAAVVLMIIYEIWWIRYFRSSKTLTDFYRSFLHIPVAGATLPVAAFLLLGIYGKVIWLIISAVIFGIGHIGIHLQHRAELEC